MLENKKNQLVLFLTGPIELKIGELSTIYIEWGDNGIIKNLNIGGENREFTEERHIYIREGKIDNTDFTD